MKLQRDWTLTQDTRHERRIVDELIRTLGKLDSCGKIVNMMHAVECGWETEVCKEEVMVAMSGRELGRKRLKFLVYLGKKLSHLLYGPEHKKTREWEDRCRDPTES